VPPVSGADRLDEFRSRRSVAYLFHAWTIVPSMSEELNCMSFLDKAKNKVEDLGGQAKEAAGKATDDKSTENEGKVDQGKANLKDAGEKVKDAFK
jgi:uncharacterized protein YjbJ (UPF0337 family)